MTASAADRSHSEKLKMTVSERSIGALTVALQDWLAGRSAGPAPPAGGGGGVPRAGGRGGPSVGVARRSGGAAAFPALGPPVGTDALRWHVDGQRDYYRWALADDGFCVPIIERGLTWLEHHWPRDRGPDVLCWGDARIGNIIYRGFEPAAVLDWEMAALGPRELDVSWFVFLHRFFQDIAEFFELDGLPDFLRRSDVERCYTELSGWTLRDMDFYLTYAALRHAIVMARVKRRMIPFCADQGSCDPT